MKYRRGLEQDIFTVLCVWLSYVAFILFFFVEKYMGGKMKLYCSTSSEGTITCLWDMLVGGWH
jgi:hypothetical protein